jgi:hypothetical protein
VSLDISTEHRRASWYTVVLLIVNIVGDGWSGRPAPFAHQIILLPFTLIFLREMHRFLFANSASDRGATIWTMRGALWLAVMFELLTVAAFLYERSHFASIGYRLNPIAAAGIFVPSLLLLGILASRSTLHARPIFIASLCIYVAGMILSIVSFPLTYLRSDMLSVILWADTNLLHHISPYTWIYVADRIYAFPYLPGMLVVYLPFVAAHIDVRFGSMIFMLATAMLVYRAARLDRRREVSVLLALFLLCPFLQYRHELYIQPHWLILVLGFVLMQRRHFAWAAFVFGIGMAIYQFSWIIFPFSVLNALRRKGWMEAAKVSLLGAAGALAIAGPFLGSAMKQIASNTVGQWGKMPHVGADPINFSYWVTYLIHPDKLMRLQAILLIAIFAYCFFRGRCTDLVDTMRWMIVALTVFILLNVLVDGYFYLMLLVVMLVYTCVANGWWSEPEESAVAIS